MSDTTTISAEKREETGSLRMKRLRQTGKIPAVLYGHGEGTVQLQVSAKDVGNAIRTGSQMVELTGAVSQNAMIKDVQWDPIGHDEVLHLDFARVRADELVELTIQLEFKGEAPGSKEGGTLSTPGRELTILCPANKIPDSLIVDCSGLGLDMAVQASDIELPEGASLVSDAGETLASCSVVVEREEAEAEEGVVEGGPAEPEVIGQKKEEEEG